MVTSTIGADRSQIEAIVRQIMQDRQVAPGSSSAPVAASPAHNNGGPNPLVVNVSARHIHVNQQAMDALFGPGSQLTKMRDLYQDGEFATEQIVNIIGPRNRMIPGVRILGPMRDYTQVELSYTDGVFMGIDLPARISGSHEGTPGCVLVGPYGAYNMTAGVVRAERHVHMSQSDMAHYAVKDGDYMKLKIDGPCGVTFDRLRVRYHPKVVLEVHIDTDEGNACDLKSATRMQLIK